MSSSKSRKFQANIDLGPDFFKRRNPKFGTDPNELPYNPWFLDMGRGTAGNIAWSEEIAKLKLMNELAMKADAAIQERRTSAAESLMKKQAEIRELEKGRESTSSGAASRALDSYVKMGMSPYDLPPEWLGEMQNRFANPAEFDRYIASRKMLPEQVQLGQQLSIDQMNAQRGDVEGSMQRNIALEKAKIADAEATAAARPWINNQAGMFNALNNRQLLVSPGANIPISEEKVGVKEFTDPKTGQKIQFPETLRSQSIKSIPASAEMLDMKVGNVFSGKGNASAKAETLGATAGSPSYIGKSRSDYEAYDASLRLEGVTTPETRSAPTTSKVAPNNESGKPPQFLDKALDGTGLFKPFKMLENAMSGAKVAGSYLGKATDKIADYMVPKPDLSPLPMPTQVPQQQQQTMQDRVTSLVSPYTSMQKTNPLMGYTFHNVGPGTNPNEFLPPQPAFSNKPYGRRNTDLPLSEVSVQDLLPMLQDNKLDNTLNNYSNYLQYLENNYGGGEEQKQQGTSQIPQVNMSGIGTSAFNNLTQTQQRKPLSELLGGMEKQRLGNQVPDSVGRPAMLEQMYRMLYDQSNNPPQIYPYYR